MIKYLIATKKFPKMKAYFSPSNSHVHVLWFEVKCKMPINFLCFCQNGEHESVSTSGEKGITCDDDKYQETKIYQASVFQLPSTFSKYSTFRNYLW